MEGKEQLLFNRLKWVSFYRVVIAFISLILLIYWKSKLDIIPDSSYFLTTLIFIFAISVVYGLIIGRIKTPLFLIVFQIVIDLLIISFIVISTGGVESPFIFFYAFIILESGIFFSKAGAYLASFTNILFIGTIFFLQYNSFYPLNKLLSSRIIYSAYDLFYSFSIFSLEFLVLGLLIGYLTSETTKIRENLAESEAKVYDLEYLKTAILSSITDGLIVFGEKNISYMNDIARNIASKIANNNHEEVLKRIFKEELEAVKEQQVIKRFEKTVPINSGEVIWLNCTVSPLLGHDNKMFGILLSFHDLTHIKAMEESLRISDKFAFIGKLSTVIAHEIRNPLASLKGSIEYLKENMVLDDESKKVFEIVGREIERLNKFITDFLSYSRNIELNISKIYLKNLVEEIWYELMFSFEDKDSFSLHYLGDEKTIINGDPNQIRQVFFNLFINSVQAIQSKKGKGAIFVSVKDATDSVTITVEDDAGGIEEKNLDKIFDPFFTTKSGGTGLGLAIVYKIINEHGGKITVTNTEKGAKFSLRFFK